MALEKVTANSARSANGPCRGSREPLNKHCFKSGVNSQTEDSDPLIHSRRLFGPRLARSGQFGAARRHYAAVAISFLRTMNSFTSAQVANNRLAFLASPR